MPIAVLVNTQVRASVAFVDKTVTPNVPKDPTVVTLKVTHPSGTVDTYTYTSGSGDPQSKIIKDTGTGNYYADLTVDALYGWHLRWDGTGALVAPVVDDIYVYNG